MGILKAFSRVVRQLANQQVYEMGFEDGRSGSPRRITSAVLVLHGGNLSAPGCPNLLGKSFSKQVSTSSKLLKDFRRDVLVQVGISSYAKETEFLSKTRFLPMAHGFPP